MTGISDIELPLIEEIEFRMIASEPLYDHPGRTADIRVFSKVGVEPAKLGVVPDLRHRVELWRHKLPDGTLRFLFAGEECNALVLNVEKDEHLILASTGKRGFGNQCANVHDSVSGPCSSSPDANEYCRSLYLHIFTWV